MRQGGWGFKALRRRSRWERPRPRWLASQAAPVATVAQRMDAMTLSTTRINDPASGRVYPFLDCRDAVALLNPDAIRALPANGAQPLLPPRSGPSSSRPRPALPAVVLQAGVGRGEGTVEGVPRGQPPRTVSRQR